MFVGWLDGLDGAVEEMLNGPHYLVGAAVAIAGQIEGAGSKGIEEGADFWLRVHDMNVLAQLMLGDDWLDGVDALEVVGNQVEEEGLGVLGPGERGGRGSAGIAAVVLERGRGGTVGRGVALLGGGCWENGRRCGRCAGGLVPKFRDNMAAAALGALLAGGRVDAAEAQVGALLAAFLAVTLDLAALAGVAGFGNSFLGGRVHGSGSWCIWHRAEPAPSLYKC